jgi:hypothetical protein
MHPATRNRQLNQIAMNTGTLSLLSLTAFGYTVALLVHEMITPVTQTQPISGPNLVAG